jgi:predicted RNA-binding Zn-ribbon protein involved in translation (DUF1610 family)
MASDIPPSFEVDEAPLCMLCGAELPPRESDNPFMCQKCGALSITAAVPKLEVQEDE